MCWRNQNRTEDDTSIDWKHHAYLEIVRYFQFFVALNTAFGIWGWIEIDSPVIAGLNPSYQQTCSKFNEFMGALSIGCFVESGITLFLAMSVFSVPSGGWWALSTVLSFGLFSVYFLFKTIALMIGILWIWGENANICEIIASPLYQSASRYLFALLVVYGFQIFVGTAFLFGCGLGKAVDEGWNKCLNPPQSPLDLSDDEAEEHYEEQRELLSGGKRKKKNKKTTDDTRSEGEEEEGEGRREGEAEEEGELQTETTGTMKSTLDMNSPITVNYFGSS